MSIQIPLRNEQTYTQVVQLNGSLYKFKTFWNSMDSKWILDIYETDGTPLRVGLALVPNINLFSDSTILTEQIGQIRMVDTSGDKNQGYTVDALGNTLLMFYFTPGEFESEAGISREPQPIPVSYELSDYFTVK